MGEIADRAMQAFRNYVTDGVPGSGANEPDKGDIRALFRTIDVAVYAAQAGITTVADLTARDAFYADEANRGKLVYVNNNNDEADDPDNGVYEYVGGARIAEGFYQGVLTTVQPLIDASEAATASAGQALPSSFTVDRRQSQSTDLGWPVRAIFEQGYFDGSGNEIDSATTLRSVDRIPVTKGDTFTTTVGGLWTLALWIFDAAGAFVASTSLQNTKGGVSLVPNDGFARLMIRKNPASNVTPADVVDHDPGIRLVRNPANAKVYNPDAGVGSLPRGALISGDTTVTNLPIVLGGFQVDGTPNASSTRASTGFLFLGKGTEITSTDGYEFAENIYDADRTYVSGAAVWRTSLTLASDTLVRLHLRKSDNSSLVGINSAPWLSIAWVQPAIAKQASDIANGIIEPEHLSFAIPGMQPAPDAFHLIWMLGESHVAGRGPTLPDPVAEGWGYKYVRSTTSLAQLADPTGNDATALLGKGSYGPAIGKAILAASGGSLGAIIVNSALGGTKIADWADGESAWTQAKADLDGALAAIKAAGIAISGVSILIGIGSNDAAADRDKAVFKAGLLNLIGRARAYADAGPVPVGLVLTGPFSPAAHETAVQGIQEAQIDLANEEDGVFLVTDAPRYAAERDWFIDDTHFNQEANDAIGRAGGPALLTLGAGRAPAGLA